jgi:hypothetical protein
MGARSSLEAALALAVRGFSIIPVPRRFYLDPDTGEMVGGKKPDIPWRVYQERRATEREIRAWFRRDQNIGVVTGAVSGVVVVDADSPAALAWLVRHLPYTPWQTRTAKGFHLYYRHPGSEVRNRARLDTRGGRVEVDVRGDGGYVVGPGSVHATGALYEFAGDWSRPDIPMFSPDWIAKPPRPAPRPTELRPTGDVVTRARRYLAAIPRPEIGSGSDAAVLYAACRLVRGFALSESEATSLLWEWCGSRPGWSHEWVSRKARNAASYGDEPVGALR